MGEMKISGEKAIEVLGHNLPIVVSVNPQSGFETEVPIEIDAQGNPETFTMLSSTPAGWFLGYCNRDGMPCYMSPDCLIHSMETE